MKIYKETKDENIEPVLRLIQLGENVGVAVVDENGRTISNLLNISKNGVYLNKYISSHLGFPLDEKGKLKVIP